MSNQIICNKESWNIENDKKIIRIKLQYNKSIVLSIDCQGE